MPCPDEPTLVALLGGTLPARERSALDDHLDSCPSCLELVALLAGSTVG